MASVVSVAVGDSVSELQCLMGKMSTPKRVCFPAVVLTKCDDRFDSDLSAVKGDIDVSLKLS